MVRIISLLSVLLFFAVTPCWSQLYVKNERQLTFGKGEDQAPAWSPDGKHIAFHSLKDARNYDIWLVAPEGGEPRRVTTTKADEGHPAWSPDGKRIAFVRYRDSLLYSKKSVISLSNDIFVTDRDGKNEIRLTDDGTSKQHLVFTPDGKSIVYSEARGSGPTFETDVWVLDIATKAKKKLIDGYKERTAIAGAFIVNGLSVSKDGKNLVFDAVFERPGWLARGIFMMDMKTKKIKSIVDDMKRAWYPDIQPNGGWVVFHAGKKGADGLFVVHSDGTGKASLIRSGKSDRHASWSPDGKSITYVKGSGDYVHIWVLELEDK